MSANVLASRAGVAPSRIAILGGGISGLTAAHHLCRLLPESQITLLEADETRFGGWIKSLSQITPPSHPAIDVAGELIFEAGPRSITTKGLAGWRALELVKNLHLEDQVVPVSSDSDAAKNRLIYYPDRVGLLPRSLTSLVLRSRQEPNVGLLGALLREPRQPARPPGAMGDESIDAFFRRRLGPEVADKIISAVIHGIWGGDSRTLSMSAAFPALVKTEREHGSLLKGQIASIMARFSRKRDDDILQSRDTSAMHRLRDTFEPSFRKLMDKSMSWSLHGGLETLVESLVSDLGTRGADLRLGSPVKSISPAAEGVAIETNGGTIEATHIVSTIPSTQLASLLPGSAGLPYLRHNPSANVGVVNLAFFHASSYHLTPVAGAGYLVPRNVAPDYNPFSVLGVTFDSDLLPNLDSGFSLPPMTPTYHAPLATVYTKLSVLLGGPHWAGKPMHALPNSETLIQQAVRTLQGHFDWPRSMVPAFAHAHLQKECIPQYLVGHPQRMRNLAAAIRRGPWHGKLSLAGASYAGVSVRDCILSGYEVARRLAAGLPTHGLERIEAGAMGDAVEAVPVEDTEGLLGDVSR